MNLHPLNMGGGGSGLTGTFGRLHLLSVNSPALILSKTSGASLAKIGPQKEKANSGKRTGKIG